MEKARALAAIQAEKAARGEVDDEIGRGEYKCGVCVRRYLVSVHLFPCRCPCVPFSWYYNHKRECCSDLFAFPFASCVFLFNGAFSTLRHILTTDATLQRTLHAVQGFFPKKTVHNCDEEKLKIVQEPELKRGSYKCGDCGFKPKKAPHDCEAVRKAKGLPPLSRNAANPFVSHTHVPPQTHARAVVATIATSANVVGMTEAVLKEEVQTIGPLIKSSTLHTP